MRLRRLLTASAVLISVLSSDPLLTADEGPDAATRALLREVREAQKELQTARAKCQIFSEYSLIERTVIQEGTVSWQRSPDGSIRQRWDLSPSAGEAEEPTVVSTLLVLGDEIVYLKNGKIEERGPVRAADLFHHPALGGLVLAVPSDEALKDPEFTITALPVGKSPGPGKEDPTPPKRSAGEEPREPDAAAPAPGSIYITMLPRRPPWTGVLENVTMTLEPRHKMIVSACYLENNRNEYSVSFSSVEANPKLDEHLFDLPPQ